MLFKIAIKCKLDREMSKENTYSYCNKIRMDIKQINLVK